MGISQSCEEFGGIGCGCGAKKFVATIVKLFNGSILYISVPFLCYVCWVASYYFQSLCFR
jgi:hypothetical protein